MHRRITKNRKTILVFFVIFDGYFVVFVVEQT